MDRIVERQQRGVRSAGVVAAAAYLLILIAPSAGQAGTVWLDRPGTGTPVPPFRLAVTAANDAEAIDLRIYEAHRRSKTGQTERLVVFKNMAGTLDVGQAIGGSCSFARKPGFRIRPQPERSVVECRAGDIGQIFFVGTNLADLLCTIDPANAELNISYDAHLNGGHDAATGGATADELNGGEGHDALRGSGGRDRMFGYEFPEDDSHVAVLRDRDSLWGEQGSDFLWGGPGSDEVVGGPGTDQLCGADARTFNFHDEDMPNGGLEGCVDLFDRDNSNRLFGNESRDIELDFGQPAPTAMEQDFLFCGGEVDDESVRDWDHSIQYSAALDIPLGCPSRLAAVADPPQYPNPYRSPFQKSLADGSKQCPPIKQ